MDSRVYHGLLQRVGDEGCYQVWVLILCGTLAFQAASFSILNTFLFYQDEFQCDSSVNNCRQYVCSLSSDQQEAFINPQFSSMLTRFGNYRCDMAGEPMSAQLIIYFGSIVSLFVAAAFDRYFKSKHLLIFCILMNIAGISITLLSVSLAMATAGLFVNFISRGVLIGLCFSFVSQTTSQSIRAKYTLWLMLACGLGCTLVGVAFALIQPWQLAFALYSLVPLVFMLVQACFMTFDPPFEAVIKNEPVQALQQFESIAKINGVRCDIELEEIIAIKQNYRMNQMTEQSKDVSIIDLFVYPSLRCTTFIIFMLGMLINLSINGPALVLRDLPVNIYLNGAVTGSAEVFCTLVSLHFIPQWPRKKTQFISWTVSAVIAALLFIFYPCLQKDHCSDWSKGIQTVGIFVYRITATIITNSVVISATEIFPSQVKVVGMQVFSLGQTIAFFVVPPVQSFLESNQVSILLLFVVVGVLGMVLTVGLKETKDIAPPEMIEELQHEA